MRLQSNPIQSNPVLKPRLQNQQTDTTVFSHPSQHRTGQLIEIIDHKQTKVFYDTNPVTYYEKLIEAFPVQLTTTRDLFLKLVEVFGNHEKLDLKFINHTQERPPNEYNERYLYIYKRRTPSKKVEDLMLFYKPQMPEQLSPPHPRRRISFEQHRQNIINDIEQRLQEDEIKLKERLRSFFQDDPSTLTALGLNPTE